MSLLDLDFDALPDEVLRWLHNRAAEVLNARTDARVQRKMSEFRFGDPVWFKHEPSPGGRVHARVQKTNRKTISVVDEEGERWNVAPTLLRHLEPAPEDDDESDPRGEEASEPATAPAPPARPASALFPPMPKDAPETFRQMEVDLATFGLQELPSPPSPSTAEPPRGGGTQGKPPAQKKRKRKRRR